MNLEEIEKETNKARLPLKDGHNLVFGRGDENADVLFIGEAPGKNEDEQGLPFVGRAGKVLQKAIDEAGIEKYYIANILKYRPPKNRDPTFQEIKAHTPFLLKQIQAIKPKVICTLGNYSTKFVLAGFITKNMNKQPGISSVRGEAQTIKLEENPYTILPIYHPAATLYNPKLRPIFKKDLEKASKLTTQQKLI